MLHIGVSVLLRVDLMTHPRPVWRLIHAMDYGDPAPGARGLAAGPLAGGQSAAAVLLAEGEGGGGDPTHGADFGNGAAAEACHQDHGDHIIGIQACAGGLGSGWPSSKRDADLPASSSIASAFCNGGDDGSSRWLSGSIQTTRRSTDSRTGVGSPNFSSRDGQITTTCQGRIGRPFSSGALNT